MRRVLVTGSRAWTDTATMRDALARVWVGGTAVLVSGAGPTVLVLGESDDGPVEVPEGWRGLELDIVSSGATVVSS